MTASHSFNFLASGADAQRRITALGAAIVLRDSSFRGRSTHSERKACRTLMREAALKWRCGPQKLHGLP